MFKITIEEMKPYEVKTTRYDASDGKRYITSYAVPKGADYKEVEIKTGATEYSSREIFKQEVESLDLESVIKAINKII